MIAYFAWRAEPSLWLPALAAGASFGLAIVVRRVAVARGVLLAIGFAAAGFASARLQTSLALPWADVPRNAVVITGAIAQVEALPDGRRVTVVAPSLDGAPPLRRAVRVRLRDTDALDLSPGDGIKVRAILRPPSPPSYPGGWDTQRDAFFNGVAAFGFAIGPASLVKPGAGSALQRLRETIATRVMDALPGPRGAIAATLLTGLGAAIPADDRAAFQTSGLAHLLAVAGLHIGIVMGLVFAAVRAAGGSSEYVALHWPVKRIAGVAALAGGLLYLGLTGGHLPILRSFMMACLVTLALLTGRRALSVRALALAALVLMALSPDRVMGVSFQMSFASVLALIAGWEALAAWLRAVGAGTWWRTPAIYAGGLAATSALAGTASLPYAAYHFGNATLFYVPANMLAVPLTALWVMPWGIMALLLMPFGLAHLCLVAMGWGIAGLLAIAHAVADWPGAVLAVPQMPAWGLLLVSAGLAWGCLWRGATRLAGVAPLLLGLASPWLLVPPDIVVSQEARVISVRSGGSVFVSTQKGATRFDMDIPQRVWGLRDMDADHAATFCGAGGCRIRRNGRAALLVTGVSAPCDGVDVVISAMPMRGRCDAPLVVDRFSVLDNGATAVWLGARGVWALTDRAQRGDRPWVIPASAHFAASTLPPATTE